MAIVWVVAQIGIGTVATSLPQLMLRTGFFGFVLGTTVPTWSRTAPRPNSTSAVDAAHTASRRPVHERTAA